MLICFLSVNSYEPWWRVDLERMYSITSVTVVIYNDLHMCRSCSKFSFWSDYSNFLKVWGILTTKRTISGKFWKKKNKTYKKTFWYSKEHTFRSHLVPKSNLYFCFSKYSWNLLIQDHLDDKPLNAIRDIMSGFSPVV